MNSNYILSESSPKYSKCDFVKSKYLSEQSNWRVKTNSNSQIKSTDTTHNYTTTIWDLIYTSLQYFMLNLSESNKS